jgi:hypothetical protein
MNLKKYAATLMVSSVLLGGCSSGSSDIKQKDGKDIVASLTDKNIYADDIYNKLSTSNTGKSAIFNAVLKELINKHFPIDDAMETDADMMIDGIKNSYKNNYGENSDAQLETDLASQGFTDLDDYRDSLLTSLQSTKFLQKYINDNYDEVFEDYYTNATPRTLSIIKISMIDIANPTEQESAKLSEVQALVNTSKDFNETATQYSDDENVATTNGKLPGVIDTTSGLSDTYGSEVETAALALSEGQISEPIKGTDAYYIVKCDSTNKDVIKDKIKNLGMDSPLLTYDSYLAYIAYNSYKLTYKDDSIKEMVANVVDEALKARDEERGGTE